jgi:5-bromo-4-chloroindolyl phosphate hydrolysis protein
MQLPQNIWQRLKQNKVVCTELNSVQIANTPGLLPPLYANAALSDLSEEQKAGLSEEQISLLQNQLEQSRAKLIASASLLVTYDVESSNKLNEVLVRAGYTCFAFTYDNRYFTEATK